MSMLPSVTLLASFVFFSHAWFLFPTVPSTEGLSLNSSFEFTSPDRDGRALFNISQAQRMKFLYQVGRLEHHGHVNGSLTHLYWNGTWMDTWFNFTVSTIFDVYWQRGIYYELNPSLRYCSVQCEQVQGGLCFGGSSTHSDYSSVPFNCHFEPHLAECVWQSDRSSTYFQTSYNPTPSPGEPFTLDISGPKYPFGIMVSTANITTPAKFSTGFKKEALKIRIPRECGWGNSVSSRDRSDETFRNY